MGDLSRELTVEMLENEQWCRIAETIGAENFCRLADILGGETVYIPKTESLVRPVRDAHIKAEFNGFNHSELAKKYNVTERWVRELCGPGIAEGQLGFFDGFDGIS